MYSRIDRIWVFVSPKQLQVDFFFFVSIKDTREERLKVELRHGRRKKRGISMLCFYSLVCTVLDQKICSVTLPQGLDSKHNDVDRSRYGRFGGVVTEMCR
jgi:hypothetical protein